MTITYLYHSGFAIETEEAYFVIDYWRDTDDGIVANMIAQDEKTVYFLSSHVHHDHFNPEIIFFGQHIKYILSADIRRKNKVLRTDDRITWVHRGEQYEDKRVKIYALGSTDVGVSFCIETEGRRIFHAGDFNNWQRTTASEYDNMQMANYFTSELTKMEDIVSNCDVAMFPLDPRMGDLTAAGAVQFCKAVHPKQLIPMHCWEMYAEANTFGREIEQVGSRFIPTNKSGDAIVL